MREDPSDELGAAAFLAKLGDRVKEARARRGMTRKILARDSGVSERYLAQLETGQGNISIVLLRALALALDVPLESIVRDRPEASGELAQVNAFLQRLAPDDVVEARRLLAARFGNLDDAARRGRIALVGLRGAGKSTLGKRLAERRGVPFVELDREVEAASGMTLSEIFDLYGQAGFRRLERQALDRVIATHPRLVLATGGSIVSQPDTFAELLLACYTVWIRARPGEHMQRVVAQGDLRPMADNAEAMADLERILAGREALYRKADAVVDTAGLTVDAALDELSDATHGVSAAAEWVEGLNS
ncbi:MAG: helix-turn-helix transcriptional regulator [Candidatus Eremiobacteraeota bacterium]|nr:helix-turn-helix transcriptional regulator [Candidatus Eremiobacteraeota bacterium]